MKFSFYENDRDLEPNTRDENAKPKAEVEMVYDGAGGRKQKIERIFNNDKTITVNGKLYSGGFVYTATNTINDGEADNLVYELDYVNTPGGRIEYENGVEQERFVYLQDHLGSTRMTLNEAGVVVESDLYTAYGEEVDMVTANETTEKFTGKELDKDGAVDDANGDPITKGMGLNFFGWRYYDPVVGYWISRDPKEQFWSGYSYTGNGFNPINSTDPDGLKVRFSNFIKEMAIMGELMKYGIAKEKAFLTYIFTSSEVYVFEPLKNLGGQAVYVANQGVKTGGTIYYDPALINSGFLLHELGHVDQHSKGIIRVDKNDNVIPRDVSIEEKPFFRQAKYIIRNKNNIKFSTAELYSANLIVKAGLGKPLRDLLYNPNTLQSPGFDYKSLGYTNNKK